MKNEIYKKLKKEAINYRDFDLLLRLLEEREEMYPILREKEIKKMNNDLKEVL